MGESEKYLYCIIRCQQDRTFDVAGTDGEGRPVYALSHKGLAVVVSDTSLRRYESSRKNMMAHERVLEKVMEEFTVLPVRFGTVTDSATPAESIRKLLSSRFEEFNKLLEEMEGKVELGLKAFWRDEKAVFDEIVAENSDIRRLRDSLSGKPPEAIRFEGIRLGQMVKEALERKRSQEAARILVPLRPIARRVRENEVLMDRLILNAAFLVDRERELEFDQAVRQLDEGLGHRIACKYVGPIPPYNFVNLVVNWQEL